jgi:sulfide:quinone oxidoreductase
MKDILVLGAGTAGTIMVNKLRKALDPDEWRITVVDRHKTHYYQPGFLFIPFGIYKKHDVVKPKCEFIPDGVDFVHESVDRIEMDKNQVLLQSGRVLRYDFLIVSTGAQICPGETPGLKDNGWYKDIFDFYTIEGALALHERFKDFHGGRLVMNIAELPYKCPVAPLEFVFLADAYFQQIGIRDKVEITYVTPLPGAFTKPRASKMLGELLVRKNVHVVPEFYLERVDHETKTIHSYDGQEVKYDVLTIVPVNMGDPVVERSGLGDDLNFIYTDRHTLRSRDYENVFVLGDAANIPTSKAGSGAHYASDILFENMMTAIDGREPQARYDGHVSCYIETGSGEGSLIDFNYDTEPLSGTYPLPGLGPFRLLRVNKTNHYGKMLFRWMYWHMLLKGKEMPLESEMSMAGKKL